MLAAEEIRFVSTLSDKRKLRATFKLKKMVVNGQLQF